MPRRSLLLPPLLVGSLVLVGCTGAPAADPSAPADLGTGSVAALPDDEVHTGGGAAVVAPPAQLAYGTTYTFENGLTVTVGAPEPFTPSAAVSTAGTWTAFTGVAITVVNDTEEDYDPQALFVNATSADVPAEQVFDAAAGVTGAPSTPVPSTGSTTFDLAFGVTDPAQLSLEITPDFALESVVYAS